MRHTFCATASCGIWRWRSVNPLPAELPRSAVSAHGQPHARPLHPPPYIASCVRACPPVLRLRTVRVPPVLRLRTVQAPLVDEPVEQRLLRRVVLPPEELVELLEPLPLEGASGEELVERLGRRRAHGRPVPAERHPDLVRAAHQEEHALDLLFHGLVLPRTSTDVEFGPKRKHNVPQCWRFCALECVGHPYRAHSSSGSQAWQSVRISSERHLGPHVRGGGAGPNRRWGGSPDGHSPPPRCWCASKRAAPVKKGGVTR